MGILIHVGLAREWLSAGQSCCAGAYIPFGAGRRNCIGTGAVWLATHEQDGLQSGLRHRRPAILGRLADK